MKNVSRPLMRLATAHACSAGNSKTQSPQSSALPLLATTSTVTQYYSPTITTRPNLIQPIQCNFTTTAYENARRSYIPLGTLALLSGVLLCLGNSTADAFSLPFLNKNTPATRMKERLSKHGYYEKVVVPDGNCQMRSLADQLHGDENLYKDVRSKLMAWLSINEKFPIDDKGSATLGDFIDQDDYPKWGNYVSYMSRDGSWGDHITLVAAAEVFGANIKIISNVDDAGTENYVTNILPKSKKYTKTLNLSHWHEMHYNSLHPVQSQGASGQREL